MSPVMIALAVAGALALLLALSAASGSAQQPPSCRDTGLRTTEEHRDDWAEHCKVQWPACAQEFAREQDKPCMQSCPDGYVQTSPGYCTAPYNTPHGSCNQASGPFNDYDEARRRDWARQCGVKWPACN